MPLHRLVSAFGTFSMAGMAFAALAQDAAPLLAPVEPVPLAGIVIEGEEAAPLTLGGQMENYAVGAISMALVRDGKVVGATARTADGMPLPLETQFQAASISKPVAAMGLLRLAQKHDLDLDADIGTHIKGWQADYTAFEGTERVTIRRLLAHRAGLTVSGFPGYAPDGEAPGTLGVLSGDGNTGKVELKQAPGTGFSYSGGGYTVAQLLVEELSGLSFADYIEREVLVPFGMSNSHFRDAPSEQFAPARSGTGELLESPYHVYPEKAAAGLWTTAADLGRFLIAVDDVVEGERPDYLAPELAAELLRIPDGWEEDYALGFGVDKADAYHVFQHSGSNYGYKSIMFYDSVSDGGGIVLADASRGSDLNREIARWMSGELGINHIPQRKVTLTAQSNEDWQKLAGEWELVAGGSVVAKLKLEQADPQTLRATDLDNGREMVFLATGPLEFLDTGAGHSLNFSATEDGTLEGLYEGRMQVRKVSD